MIFNGKTFAAKRREELMGLRQNFGVLSLGVVMGENDPVTSSFVRVKEKNAAMLGITLARYTISQDATTEDVIAIIKEASKESGLIVQLPLPPQVDTEAVLAAIPVAKDVDALSPVASEKVQRGDVSILPPVAAAIRSIVEAENVIVQGKKVMVVGKGRLVGAPCAQLFANLGGNVISVDRESTGIDFRDADIIVLGAGAPHFLKADMVKEGVVVFDAGTSESNGVVVGDADPTVAEKASFFTPTPGGIGPVAVVEIFGNLLRLQ